MQAPSDNSPDRTDTPGRTGEDGRRASDALTISETICTRLLAISTDAIVAVDEDQRIKLFNPGAEAIFGYSAQEVLDLPLDLLIPEALRQLHHQHVRRFAASDIQARRMGERGQVSGRRKNGEMFPADASISKVEVGGEWFFIAVLRDISAAARTEEALNQATETLRNLILASPLAIVALDPSGQVDIWNPAAERIFGWSEKETVGRPYPIVPRERLDEFQAELKAALRGEATIGYETDRQRKDGSIVPVRVSAARRGETAADRGLVVLMEDITAYKQAKEAERRLTAILETTPDVVAITDPEGNVLYLNQAGRRICGIEKQNVPELMIPDFHPAPVTAQLLHEAIPTAVRTGSWKGETTLLGAGGVEIPVSQVVLAHRDARDRLEYLSTVMRDISDRKRLEARQSFLVSATRVLSGSLEEAEVVERLTHLVVPDLADFCIVHVVDDAGRCKQATVLHRDSAHIELINKMRRFPPNGKQTVGVAHVLRTGEPELVSEVTDAWLKASTESRRLREILADLAPVSLLIVPLRARDRVLGAITLMHTDSRRRYGPHDLGLAQALAERLTLAIVNARLHGEAQQALHARDEVLRVVAHDLRDPLNTILLSADLIRDCLPAEALKAAGQPIEIIQRSAERANRLIDDLLDVARIEAGKLTMERKAVDSLELVEEAALMHRNVVQDKGLELVVRTPPKLPFIQADHDRILQVLGNLLGNAIKFTPEGGRITLSGAAEERAVRFRITDTGPGIPAEDQKQLFQPFWQARKGTGIGAGLGLTISRAIVGAHEGRIWVESEEGRGTTVSFTVPVADGKKKVSHRSRTSNEGGSLRHRAA
jgi:PAS domain S-box-containing protein